MTLTMHTACEQLCRWWAEESGLTFADPASEPSGVVPPKRDIYAAPLPRREHRRTPAASLTPLSGEGGDGYAVMRAQIDAVARAADERSAAEMVADLRNRVRQDGRPWRFDPPAHSGDVELHGLIGFPPPKSLDTGGALDLWRFLAIDVRADVQITSFIAGDGATGEGEAEARLGLTAFLVPAAGFPAPGSPFALHHPGGGDDLATVDVSGGTLTLTFAGAGPVQTDEYDLSEPLVATVAELRSAIEAETDWAATGIDAGFDARPSIELLNITIGGAIGAAGAAPLRMHG